MIYLASTCYYQRWHSAYCCASPFLLRALKGKRKENVPRILCEIECYVPIARAQVASRFNRNVYCKQERQLARIITIMAWKRTVKTAYNLTTQLLAARRACG